nr:protein split ends-like [Oncorhynchus nerka]
MTCVEKRQHVSHRSTMLHHRFPNGFTEIFMDETDREVSTLTDRAFRSLCIGDEAAYNDEFSYGYPFSCHKPLVEEPLKRTKDTGKKHQINGTIGTQPWKQQKSMSSLTLLKAFSATEEKCEGMLIKNWDFKDTNGDSWDKSALLSIERELSEFSSDYNNLIAKKSGKDAKFSKTKNCISNFKLRKLHIKNCFLHSEFSPFQSWRDFNHSPFGQEDITSIPHVVDNLPKWYDSPLYKELTEAHRIETLRAEEMEQQCQKSVEPPPPPRPPPKVLPKPSAPEKRCASDTSSQGETSTPWRRNRVRVKSAVPVNQPGLLCTPTETPKLVEESNIPYKKKVKSIKVKEVEEPCSLTSTPFSISQLMTPIIPSRQATDTSEILSAVLSPSLLDLTRLDLEHVSPVKSRSTPEVIKRESYKSIASSLLFNLKDNRKRVKSRYSPPKFKTEQADRRTLSPKLLEQRLLKYAHAPSDVTASGFSTPAILASGFSTPAILASGFSTPAILLDGLPICSPDVSESSNAGLRKYLDSDISDDYLISNLLQTKREAAASRSPGSPLSHPKVNKSPRTKKQMYPTLNLYNSLVEPEIKHFSPSMNKDTLSITTPNKGLSPNMSDNTKDHPTTQKDRISLNISENPVKEMSALKEKGVGDPPVHTRTNREALPTAQNKVLSPNRTDHAKQPTKDTVEFKEKHNDEQTASTREAITATRDTLITAENEMLPSNRTYNTNRSTKDMIELNVKDSVEEVMRAGMEAIFTTRNKLFSPNRAEAVEALTNKTNIVKTEDPQVKDEKGIVVEDRHLFYSFSVPRPSYRQIEPQATGDIYPMENILANGVIESSEKEKECLVVEKEKEPVKEQGRFKHIFSARQNNYIKSQRYALMENGEEEQEEEDLEPKMEVNNKRDMDKEEQDAESSVHREMKDSENIISDLHALKELEKARLGGRHSKDGENLKPKPMIDGEAKAKNDLISRELRNIKRGILSMRGNTFAKKEAFANKEKEQARRDVFSKIDNNVVVNKSLINDNYDKAKMALEEIISDRAEKRKNQVFSNKECENNRVPDDNPDDSYNVRVQKSRQSRQDYIRKATEGKQNEVRGRLGDLKDHHQIQGILSQTETKLCENHRFGATIYTEQNKLATGYIREEQVQGNAINNVSGKQKHNIRSSKYPAEESDRTVAKQLSVETRDDTSRNDEVVTEESQPDAPVIKPKVPPRSKKGSIKKEDSSEKEKECANVMDIIEEGTKNKDFSIRDSKNDNILRKENTHARGKVSSKEALDAKIQADQQTDALETEKTAEQEKRFVQNKHHVGLPGEYSKYPHEANTCFSPSEEKEKELKALLNERQTNTLPRKKLKAEKIQHNIEQQEQLCVRRKAPLKPDKDHSKHSNQVNTSTEDESIMKKDSMKKIQATEESDKSVRVCEDIVHVDEVLDQDIRETLVSPLSNGSSINPSQQNQTSMSPKSSYFFVENTLQRNLETDSNIYHSLENLIAKYEEVEEGVKDGPERVRGDLERRTEVDYYSVSDHENEDFEDKPVVRPRRDRETSLKEENGPRAREMDKRGWFQSPMDNTNNQTPTSQSNVSSPVLGKPALFKVKDNILNDHVSPVTKTVKPVLDKTNHDPSQRAPWSPRESLSGSEKSEEEHLDHPKTSIEMQSPDNAVTTPDKHFKPKETASPHSSHSLLSPSKLTPEHNRKGQRAPWSPRESLSGSERGEEDHLEIPELHAATITTDKHLKPRETASHHSPLTPLSPSKLTPENSQRGQQYGSFLTVTQEYNKHSRLSPSSEERTSTMDTADDTPDVYKVSSERSGSVCRANDTQGPGRPPVVPPKSEKALFKAMKLTTRRIQKEEKESQPQKSSTKSCSSRSDKNKRDKSSEQKSSSSDSSEKHRIRGKQHQERTEHSSRSSEKHRHGESEHQGRSREKHRHNESESQARNSEKHHNDVPEHQRHSSEKSRQERTEPSRRGSEEHRHGESTRQQCSSDNQRHGGSERQSRNKQCCERSEKQSRDKPEQRFRSSDRAVSEQKSPNGERSMTGRQQRLRSQSMDRHIGNKAEERIRSSETSPRERPEPRSQRIEKSIRDELSQRGRARERSNREKLEHRNHSVDSYASDIIDLTSPHPNLSRQSSYTGQFSRQSSIEHRYASFPMTQRKLLQDPDSGQYFVVDMPVQVKTKTFFDPETGNYVQLPIQPPEGPTMEVMNAPMVLYQGSFVPVPVSSIPSQKSTVHPSQLDQEDFERMRERQRYKHNGEGHPYLEPVYGSQDHMLGEFLGTEDLYDCMN